MPKPLPRSFYARPTLEVAPELLGKILHHGTMSARIVEVEAYRAGDDPASHAYRGLTPRNKIMFGVPGHLYVYFIYGMYYCANVVCEKEGTAGACLIRAVEPLDGVERMQANRVMARGFALSNGPGKLCLALGIDKSHNGTDLTTDDLYLSDDRYHAKIKTSPRIGIRVGTEKKWRYFIDGNAWLSPSRDNK